MPQNPEQREHEHQRHQIVINQTCKDFEALANKGGKLPDAKAPNPAALPIQKRILRAMDLMRNMKATQRWETIDQAVTYRSSVQPQPPTPDNPRGTPQASVSKGDTDVNVGQELMTPTQPTTPFPKAGPTPNMPTAENSQPDTQPTSLAPEPKDGQKKSTATAALSVMDEKVPSQGR